MKKNTRKILTILLSVMIVLTYMVPGSVFADSTRAAGDVYLLVDSLEDGGEYLIVNGNEAGSRRALTNPGGTSSGASMGKTTIEIVDIDGTPGFEDPADDIIWTATANGGGFILTNGGDYLEGKSGNVKIFSAQQNADRYWTYNDSTLKFNDSYTLYYSNGSFTASTSSSGSIYLYKKTAAGTAPVSGVALDQTELTIKQGKTAKLKATVSPSDAADKTVFWRTSDDTVATVENGTVTGVGPGTATITVETQDGGFTATCAVTVEAVQLDTYVLTDEMTEGDYLIVSTNEAGNAYALTNNGASSSGGNLGATAVTIVNKNGSLSIETDEDSIVWTATSNVDGFNLTNNGGYLEGKSGNLKIFDSQQYPTRYWTYSNNQLVHINPNPGNNSVNYTLYYGSSGFTQDTNSGNSRKVYIFGKPGTAAVTGVTLDQEEITLKVGKTQTLKATVLPSDAANKKVSWSTSAPSVATVENGTVTAVGSGEATITVETEDGNFKATCKVTVPESQIDTYKLVDTITSGNEYLIVSANAAGTAYALTNPGGTSDGANMGSTQVTIVAQTRAAGDLVISEDSDNDAIVWTATEHDNLFNLTNGSDYLEGKRGDVKIFNANQYPDRGWSYTDNQLKHTGGDNTYVVYYDNGFTSTYNSTDGKVYLFEKDAGGTEPGTDPVESVTLDQSEITVKVGKTANLTATVLPATAEDKTVTWSVLDDTVATVSQTGVVTGVKEGSTTVTATSNSDSTKYASCTVTVEANAAGTETHVGVTSDVHGSISRLESWLTAVQAEYDPDLDSMLYCGDYSYQMNNLSSYLSDFNAVVTTTNDLVGEGKAVYTSGNHEYYINGVQTTLNTTFTNTPGWVTIGPALEKSNYIVFCMGACEWDANGNYPQSDINTLREFLDSAPTDIPIIIPAHFPLHTNSTRATTNADLMIDLLNEHPNVIMLWGHNHSQSDPHYGQVRVAGDTIEYASGKTKEINFTYACAGGMYEDSQTRYSGLVMTISGSGDTVTFRYYNANGSSVGDATTIHIDGTPTVRYTITATAGEGGTITPSGAVSVVEGKDKEFTFKADTGYKIDTVTVDGRAVADPGNSYKFTNVTADHTINVTFKAKDPGEVDYYKLVNALKAGGEYLIVSSNAVGSGYALTNNGASSGGASMGATAVTIAEEDIDNDGVDDKYIILDLENVVWTATTNVSGYTLTNDGAYLEGKSGNLGIFSSQQYPERYWTYSDEKLVYINPNSGSQSVNYTLYYGSSGFTQDTGSNSSRKVYIYEKTEYAQGTDPVSSVTLDKSEITVKEGKTEKLTATVLPKTAQDKSVTWTVADNTIATVSQTGVVTGVKAGTTTVTVTSNSDNTKKATCTVTVEEVIPGSGINVGVTSDVHGNISGLRTWLQTVQDDYDPDLDSMLYCGDYSYVTNSTSNYLADFNDVIDATNTIIGQGKGVYTSGNHEYYTNGEQSSLNSGFTSAEGFTRIGEALVKDDYIVYCMGAVGWCSANGEYPQADIDAMATYLETAPSDIPILIVAHFPLHQNGSRTITNADKMIEVLNEHPNAIFFWGHNHSQSDPHYGEILVAGDTITYASGKTEEINFTYANAGGMYQDSQTNYSGVVVHIEKATKGYDVTFQYYRTSTQAPIGDETTIHIEGAESVRHTITASAGANGTITPSGSVSVIDGKDKTFTFAPNAGYEVDTVTVDGSAVTVTDDSYTFTKVTADHTIAVTFKEADVKEYVLTTAANNNGNYIVASNGYALVNNNGTISAVPVQTSADGKTIYVKTSDLEKNIIWTLKAAATEQTSGDYTVENNGYMLKRVSGGSSGGAANAAAITTEQEYSEYSGLPYFQWSYDASNTLLTMVGGQNGDSTFYFFYNTSEGKFYTDTTQGTAGLYVPASPETVWGEPTYTWAEDNSTCTALRTGTDGITTLKEEETVNASVVTTAATCETAGKKVFTADFENEAFTTQTKEVEIPALNHDWDTPTYTWNADNSKVTAKRVCKNDSKHVEEETVDVVAEVTTAATCTTDGVKTLTATFTNTAFEAQTKTEAIPALNHDWDAATYTWNADNSKVTAKRVCKNDPGHVEEETVDVVAEVTTAATCTKDGLKTLTATFTNTAFEAQTKTETIEALGHNLTEHPAKEATCTKDGNTAYWSCSRCGKFFSDAEAKNEIDKDSWVIPAYGHTWLFKGWTWADDHTYAIAKYKCVNDGCSTTKNVQVDAKIETVDAQVGVEGSITYTVTITSSKSPDKKKHTTSYVETIPALAPAAKITNLNTDVKASSNTIVLDYKSKNAVKYKIRYRVDGGSWKTIKTTEKKYTIKNIKTNAYYDIKVAGINKDGKQGKYTSLRRRYTGGIKFSAKSPSKGIVKVTAKAKTNLVGYQIRYNTNKTKTGAKSLKVKTTENLVKELELKSGTTYYVWVRPLMSRNGKTYIGVYDVKIKITVK